MLPDYCLGSRFYVPGTELEILPIVQSFSTSALGALEQDNRFLWALSCVL